MKKNIQKFNNIKEIIYHSASTYSNNIAFTVKNKNGNKVDYINHTYTDLLNDINCFGSALYKLGLKDKRVAVVGHNSYEWAVAHLSNLLGGIVSVPLDKGLQLGELENSLIRSQVQAVVFDDKLKDIMLEIKENNNTNIKYFICTSKAQDFLYFYDLLLDGKEILGNGNTEYVEHKIDSKKMSILLFTSGTTSKSKAVIFPDGLKYIQKNLVEYKVSVFVGVPVLIDKMYSTILKEVKKQGKDKLVNFMLHLSNILMKLHIDIRRTLFKQLINALGGNMRFIISGGAPLDKKVAKWFNDIGIHLVQGYGLTETSPVIAAENDTSVRYGSVGKAMGSLNIKIQNKDKEGMGEILIKGPNVMLGYYNEPELTKEVLKNGWFHTGDLGFIDKDGFLFITGRKKDLIVLKNGKKVFPEELELLINRLDFVEESFVYGLPSKEDKNDVKVAVEVVLNEKNIKEKYPNIAENEIHDIIWNEIKEINKTLPMYKYIKHLELSKEPLIKTTTNKIKRKEELKKVLGEQ